MALGLQRLTAAAVLDRSFGNVGDAEGEKTSISCVLQSGNRGAVRVSPPSSCFGMSQVVWHLEMVLYRDDEPPRAALTMFLKELVDLELAVVAPSSGSISSQGALEGSDGKSPASLKFVRHVVTLSARKICRIPCIVETWTKRLVM